MPVRLLTPARCSTCHGHRHPGNILVREINPSSWGGAVARVLRMWAPAAKLVQPQLVVLDTGMVAQLSASDKTSVLDFFTVRGSWVALPPRGGGGREEVQQVEERAGRACRA